MKNSKCDSGNTKFLAGLVIGVAAGAAAAIFVKTDEGQKLVNTIKDKASDTNDGLKDSLGKLQYTTDKVFGKIKSLISSVKKDAKAELESEDSVMDGIFS